ncbi:hypothetical protein DFH08DRAFT_934411 [Mycena albidolilacea]|uniref:Uncharacterized protein n=1 Tax=Mycena albidolilacea TaxID=1033008 RepID=A0AAD7AAN0_9AGAR|nr:hypothetical protein DFH08DRAFT_934411 [Mycena albidolilacea]
MNIKTWRQHGQLTTQQLGAANSAISVGDTSPYSILRVPELEILRPRIGYSAEQGVPQRAKPSRPPCPTEVKTAGAHLVSELRAEGLTGDEKSELDEIKKEVEQKPKLLHRDSFYKLLGCRQIGKEPSRLEVHQMIANIQDLGGWEFGQGREGGERAGVNYNLEFSYAGKGIANSNLSDEPLVGKRNQENTVFERGSEEEGIILGFQRCGKARNVRKGGADSLMNGKYGSAVKYQGVMRQARTKGAISFDDQYCRRCDKNATCCSCGRANADGWHSMVLPCPVIPYG